MKRVFSSFSLAGAHHAKNLLEMEGIRSVVRNEMLSSAMGELPPAECQIEVWVLRDDDVQRADLVLRESFSPKNGPAWRCPSCGEQCEPQFTQCWHCGANRPS